MKTVAALMLALLLGLAASSAHAQMAYVTYYQPVAVYQPVVTAAPPAPVVQTTYYAPAPQVVYQPVTEVRTRRRPILGGTVTRVRTSYAPVVVGY